MSGINGNSLVRNRVVMFGVMLLAFSVSALVFALSCNPSKPGTIPESAFNAESAGDEKSREDWQPPESTVARTVAIEQAIAEIESAPVPENVNAGVFEMLREEFIRQMEASKLDRLASAAPTGDSGRVTDLTYDDTERLSWSYVNVGDYDSSGEVGIPDITMIAQNYLAKTNDGIGGDALEAWIDGDKSGEVGISDITPIAQGYLNTVMEYRILTSSQPDSGFTVIGSPIPFGDAGVFPKTFSVIAPSGAQQYLAVVPVGNDLTQGERSNNAANLSFDYDWLFMVYMGADNDLAVAAGLDLLEMVEVGWTSDVMVAAQIEMWSDENPDLRYDTVERMRVDRDEFPENESFSREGFNSADPANIADFVQWALSNYNARNKCLVLWDHGASWLPGGLDGQSLSRLPSGMIIDFSSDDYMGDDYDIAQALAPFNLDILAFDGCSMASVECVDAYAKAADYLVFSQLPISGYGFPYTDQLAWLTTHPDSDPEFVAIDLASKYADFYIEADQVSMTISVLKTSKYPAIKSAITAFASNFINADIHADIDNMIRVDAAFDITEWYESMQGLSFEEPRNGDILDFVDCYSIVGADGRFMNLAEDIYTAVDSAIVYSSAYDCLNDEEYYAMFATGLSIWTPDEDDIYWYWEEYEQVQFAQDTRWLEMLYLLYGEQT